MAMTMTQKILAHKAGLESVEAGELISARIDMALANDITAPVAIREFDKMDCKRVFDNTKIALVPDHFTPNKDIKSAEQAKIMRDFAHKHDIKYYFEIGCMGIEHALLPEKGLVNSGELIIGADSHTCTYGALNAFSTGVGSTDLAAGMATGECWLKVPEAIRVNITGKPNKYVTGKDVALYLIGKIGVDGALYKSLEFGGDGLKYLSMDSRLTIANMAIEAGAKNGIFEYDHITDEYLCTHSSKCHKPICADVDAKYFRVIDIDLANVELCVACPSLPSNVKKVDVLHNVKIDQVVIGSCTNGRIEDMRAAANVLKGRKIATNVRCIIIPATQNIYLECIKEGLAQIFIEAGAVLSTPTCGPCLGGHMGVLAAGEKCVSTTNRNFVGRMGHTSSEVYLASPYVAAASAVAGFITKPDLLEEV